MVGPPAGHTFHVNDCLRQYATRVAHSVHILSQQNLEGGTLSTPGAWTRQDSSKAQCMKFNDDRNSRNQLHDLESL